MVENTSTKIITPKRKNQKQKKIFNENLLLKERYKVENLFADFF